MFRSIFALSFTFILLAAGALAAAPAPNLEVQAWQGNATPLVESPYQYTARVKNVGNKPAQGVVLTIEFPLTNTSPSKYILGKLSAVQANGGTCSVTSNKIVCNFGSLSNNQTKSVSFTFEFQAATTAPILKATATTSSTNEANANNNVLAFTPAIRYPDNVVSSGIYTVTSCTGRGLTSFYECEISPGSTQSFDIDLNLGGTLTVPQEPGYFGFWDQNGVPLNKTLHFTIGSDVIFDGFASNGACFKGIATFPGNTTYNAAYRVCEQ